MDGTLTKGEHGVSEVGVDGCCASHIPDFLVQDKLKEKVVAPFVATRRDEKRVR